MQRVLVAALLLTVLVISSGADLSACGDKSLSAGGIRMQRALAARYPASVLIYTPTASRLPDATRELKLQQTLQQVGHTYREVASASDLEGLVGSGRFNILLADVADVPALQQQFVSSVVVVPVLYKATKAEAAAAATQSRFVIKAPGKAAQYLTTIAEAVRSKNGTQRKG